jgi:hypothetical protein
LPYLDNMFRLSSEPNRWQIHAAAQTRHHLRLCSAQILFDKICCSTNSSFRICSNTKFRKNHSCIVWAKERVAVSLAKEWTV